jgi:ABC-type proline/glycine betaine transport system substrate-binding protein
VSDAVEAALDRWFRNGWRADHPMAAEWVANMTAALAAADKARAVTDDEVVDALSDEIGRREVVEFLGWFHAAGMKVVRA